MSNQSPLQSPGSALSGRRLLSPTVLAATLVGVVGIVALVLLLAPPATGPIYTELPPTGQEGGEDAASLLGLLPLSIAAVALVLLGAFVIPVLIRRFAAGQLDPALALAAAGRLSGRLRLIRLLPVLRLLSVGAGAVLTALTVVVTVPELLGRIGATATPNPGVDPTPVDPFTPAGGLDSATLLAMGAGVVIFGGLLLLVLPSLTLRLRLPTRSSPAAVRPVVDDHGPSVFVARTELPPEIAALFPAPPQMPTRLDRMLERLRGGGIVLRTGISWTLRAAVRSVIALLRAGARAIRAAVRGLLSLVGATIAAAGHLLATTARTLVALAMMTTRAVIASLRLLLAGIVGSARAIGRFLLGALRLIRTILFSVTWFTGSAIILGLVALGILLLALVSAIAALLIAIVTLVVQLLRAVTWGMRSVVVTLLRGIARLVAWSRRSLRALGSHTRRSAITTVRASGRLLEKARRAIVDDLRTTARHLRTTRGELVAGAKRLIDARRRPAEGGPMTTPATVLVVALAPQSGKSTVAAEAARLLGATWINSSAVIAERLEQRLGLPAGRIAETRTLDHEAYRPALIEEGNRMAAEGTSPGVECVRRGYRVIDGIRRREELEAAVTEVRARGGLPIVICVRRPNAPALADNTESAALAALADVIIENDGPLSRLRRRTSAALRRFQAL